MGQATRYFVFTFPAILIALVICCLFIDRPFAIEMSRLAWLKPSGALGFSMASFLTQVCYGLLVLVFVVYFCLSARGVKCKLLGCIAFVSQSVVFAFFIKSALQFFFGRYVPRYKGSDSLLFVRNQHLYGFHWFQSGCFPSGHMTVLTAAVISIALFYPWFKWIAFALMLVMAALLLLLNYHFLSDVIAGAYLGTSISLGIYYVKSHRQSH